MKGFEKLEEKLGKLVLNNEVLSDILNQKQNLASLEKVVGRIEGILTSEEKIEYLAVQKKPVINISPDSLVLTNKRIIIFRPKNMGLTLNFWDILWKDVQDCHIKENLLGSDFFIKNASGKRVAFIDSLPKDQARKLYRIAQEREEEMIEVRRQRAMEESRAGAANVVVSGSQQTESPSKPDDPMEKLKQLKQLFESELISNEEYESKKAEILKNL